MKKLTMAALAAITFAGPLAVSNASALTPRGDHDRYDRYDRDDRGGRGDRGDRGDRGRDWGDRDDRRDRRDYRRDDRRDDRRHGDWDRRRYNGYYYEGRFYHGPPPRAYYGHRTYRPYYRQWRRGDRLPAYYRQNYVVVHDYDRYRLRHPPRGYHWVRDDRGDYLLVGIATGVILGLILGN